MNIRKIITTIIALLGVFIFFISLQICLPDGCSYNSQIQPCSDGGCFDEDVHDHLNERGSYMFTKITDIDYENLVLLISPLFFLLVSKDIFLKTLLKSFAESRLIIKIYSFTYNRLIILFSKGILNPKTY